MDTTPIATATKAQLAELICRQEGGVPGFSRQDIARRLVNNNTRAQLVERALARLDEDGDQ